jgi:TonB family protein
MGFSRRLVLLPATMLSNLDWTEMQTVIAHEFAHIHRNDFLKNAIYELLSLPLNYHPLFWLTRQRIIESREIVCDRMAAEISGRNQYARSLLRLAALLIEELPARIPHAIGIFDANLFERRLMKLTEKETNIRGIRKLAMVTACAAFGIVTCGSALALGVHVNAQATGGDSATQTPGTLTVPAEKLVDNQLTRVSPKYPDLAKKAHVKGKVVLDVLIGKDGTMKEAHVVSGPEMLWQSSLDAVKQWTYKPYLLNGEPVEVKTTVTVTYSLKK